jgi:hypothetical protein
MVRAEAIKAIETIVVVDVSNGKEGIRLSAGNTVYKVVIKQMVKNVAGNEGSR